MRRPAAAPAAPVPVIPNVAPARAGHETAPVDAIARVPAAPFNVARIVSTPEPIFPIRTTAAPVESDAAAGFARMDSAGSRLELRARLPANASAVLVPMVF